MTQREPVTFKGPVGRLDGRAHGPPTGRPVLLLHPHPKGEGTMGSRLVYDLATGLSDIGFRVYRFDFRGVGRSEGAYGEGIGETEDAVAVFDQIQGRHGSAPMVIGHSFGAAVAIRLAGQRDVPLLVAIGTPPRISTSALAPIEDARQVGAVPGGVHMIVGSEDPFVDPEAAKALASAFPTNAELGVLEGAGHFLEPSHNPRVLEAVRAIIRG